jgi:hypothetical protein
VAPGLEVALVGVVGGLVSGTIVALVNARLARRSFISQRWWERKASAYSDVMEHLARLKMAVFACIEELEDSEPEQAEWDKYVVQWDQAAEALGVLAFQETFLISAAARACLQEMYRALSALDGQGDVIPQLKSFALSLHDNMEHLVSHAHADLAVKRDRTLAGGG